MQQRDAGRCPARSFEVVGPLTRLVQAGGVDALVLRRPMLWQQVEPPLVGHDHQDLALGQHPRGLRALIIERLEPASPSVRRSSSKVLRVSSRVTPGAVVAVGIGAGAMVAAGFLDRALLHRPRTSGKHSPSCIARTSPADDEVSSQRAWCANWRKNRMTPAATTAWALIALANGHFTITPDLSKDSCMNLARAPYGQRAICYEYLPGL